MQQTVIRKEFFPVSLHISLKKAQLYHLFNHYCGFHALLATYSHYHVLTACGFSYLCQELHDASCSSCKSRITTFSEHRLQTG